MNLSDIFGPRFRKTLLVYFPINFFFVIFLIWVTQKIFSSHKVPEWFVLNLIAKNLFIILPWAVFFSHTLYSYFDVATKKPSTDTNKDIELGPIAPALNTLDAIPTPQNRAPQNTLPAEFVEIDLGEGPSNNGLPGPPRPFLTCDV